VDAGRGPPELVEAFLEIVYGEVEPTFTYLYYKEHLRDVERLVGELIDTVGGSLFDKIAYYTARKAELHGVKLGFVYI